MRPPAHCSHADTRRLRHELPGQHDGRQCGRQRPREHVARVRPADQRPGDVARESDQVRAGRQRDDREDAVPLDSGAWRALRRNSKPIGENCMNCRSARRTPSPAVLTRLAFSFFSEFTPYICPHLPALDCIVPFCSSRLIPGQYAQHDPDVLHAVDAHAQRDGPGDRRRQLPLPQRALVRGRHWLPHRRFVGCVFRLVVRFCVF
jgi:hypothetical protein